MQHESAFTRTKKTHARERETVIWRQFQTIVDGTVESSESHMHLNRMNEVQCSACMTQRHTIAETQYSCGPRRMPVLRTPLHSGLVPALETLLPSSRRIESQDLERAMDETQTM